MMTMMTTSSLTAQVGEIDFRRRPRQLIPQPTPELQPTTDHQQYRPQFHRPAGHRSAPGVTTDTDAAPVPQARS